MHRLPPVRAIAIDVLGTLVDEPAALRAAIRELTPHADDEQRDRYREGWETHVAEQQERISRGERAYADADLLDLEAAADLAGRLGDAGSDAAARAVMVGRENLRPWSDAVAGVELLAHRHPIFGLSNATASTLDALQGRAGFQWTRGLSAAQVRAYKPSGDVYRLASDTAGVPPEQVLMIAAHAWDLRAAQAVGMRTAYVPRPVADPPAPGDRFDGEFATLAEVAHALGG